MNHIHIWFPNLAFSQNTWIIAVISSIVFCGILIYIIKHTTDDKEF